MAEKKSMKVLSQSKHSFGLRVKCWMLKCLDLWTRGLHVLLWKQEIHENGSRIFQAKFIWMAYTYILNLYLIINIWTGYFISIILCNILQKTIDGIVLFVDLINYLFIF